MNRSITKSNLDLIYSETFDIKRFKSDDPCGVVYELMNHTDSQLDIELGALFVAMISWGNRKQIIKAARHMIGEEMHWHPAYFILSEAYETSYPAAVNNCVYRTLNVPTFRSVCRNIRTSLLTLANISGDPLAVPEASFTLESLFSSLTTKEVISTLCTWLSPARIGTMDKSACKRVCMYVRWMTRATAPDLNIWTSRSASDLYAVMDTHVLQLTQHLLTNKRPTWKACEELTAIFKSWDSQDPLKYDIALMTIGTRKP